MVVDVDVDVDACGGQWTLGVLNVILSVGNQTTLLQQYPNLKAITEASKQFHFLVRIHKRPQCSSAPPTPLTETGFGPVRTASRSWAGRPAR